MAADTLSRAAASLAGGRPTEALAIAEAHLRTEIERRRAILYGDPAPVRALGEFLLGRRVT